MTIDARTLPLLDEGQMLAALRVLRSRQPVEYWAFYSSQLKGIITDPSLMIIPFDDHIVHRGHGIFDTAAIVAGQIYDLEAHLDRFLLSADRSKLRLTGSREEIREGIGRGRLSKRKGGRAPTPGRLATRLVVDQFMDTPERERHHARHARPDDRARCHKGEWTFRQHDQRDCQRLRQERETQRGSESEAVGGKSGQDRPGDGAEPEEHPVTRTGRKPLPQSASDEIDQKNHVGHEPDRSETVLDIERSERCVGRCPPVIALRLENGTAPCIWPARPRYHRQQERECAECVPGRSQSEGEQ